MHIEVQIEIPDYVNKLMAKLNDAGYEAWCVGGCVRDSLLGRIPEDWDLAVSSLPPETKQVFSDYPTFDVGMRHGTISVLSEGHTVELTTFRMDGVYSDARHPDSVQFSNSLEEDLSRRDFTVNAMAYRQNSGLRDPFDGLRDLETGLLRCVGIPAKRFSEDALRVLRCLRFSSTLGFAIEPETLQAAMDARGLLEDVSRERVRDELQKLLCGTDAAETLRRNSEILFSLLPELAPLASCNYETLYHRCSVWEHSLQVLSAVSPNPLLRWSALLHDCGKPACKRAPEKGTAHFHGDASESEQLAGMILKRLRFPNRDSDRVCSLIRYHGEAFPLPEKRLKKLLGEFGGDWVFELFSLMRANLAGQDTNRLEEHLTALRDSQELAETILSRQDCLTLRDLAVTGKDLLSLGYHPGPALGKELSFLLEKVLSGTLENDRDILLQEAEKTRS